jgi:pimeloyl-ACP methyl ester carboxylesterase
VPVGVVHDQAVGRHSTHVDDVVALLEREDLDEVVLCGQSYGGMPVTGAAQSEGWARACGSAALGRLGH